MVHWTHQRIYLARVSGALIWLLVTSLLIFVFGVDSWYAVVPGFVVALIYEVLLIQHIKKVRKNLMKEYLETGNDETLKKAFPYQKFSKK